MDEVDIENTHNALECYVTFQEIIEKAGIKDHTGKSSGFEIFQKNHIPPLLDLFEGLN